MLYVALSYNVSLETKIVESCKMYSLTKNKLTILKIENNPKSRSNNPNKPVISQPELDTTWEQFLKSEQQNKQYYAIKHFRRMGAYRSWNGKKNQILINFNKRLDFDFQSHTITSLNDSGDMYLYLSFPGLGNFR